MAEDVGEKPEQITLTCPSCAAEGDNIIRWNLDVVWEKYSCYAMRMPNGELVVEHGDHLKHGDFVETKDWIVHCDACDYEGDQETFVPGHERHEQAKAEIRKAEQERLAAQAEST